MTDAEAKPRAVAAGTCPIDIQLVKDDLGITGTADDAWLQRRMDALWSHMEDYCSRPLQPPLLYEDNWSEIAQPWQPHVPWPPAPTASVFLRRFPVLSIAQATINGDAAYDVAKIVFDAAGKLLSVDGPGLVTDLSYFLPSARAVIQYVAGLDPIPASLYEAMLGALSVQWANRQAVQSGLAVGGFLPSRINATDVGSIDLDQAPNYLVDQASRAGRVADPLLGPYVGLLEPYVDWRAMTGSAAYATTKLIGPPPAPGP